jgi:hypothetical protein
MPKYDLENLVSDCSNFSTRKAAVFFSIIVYIITREHLLINCEKIINLFQKIKLKFKEKEIQLNKEKSILHLDFSSSSK